MHSFTATTLAFALPLLASALNIPAAMPLHKREDISPGSPLYECHANCGGVIVFGEEGGSYCDNATFTTEFEACMDCAETYDIWQYYGDDVTKYAEACGLTVSPSPSSATAAATATGSAAVSTATAAVVRTSSAPVVAAASSSAVVTTSSAVAVVASYSATATATASSGFYSSGNASTSATTSVIAFEGAASRLQAIGALAGAGALGALAAF